MLKSIGVFWNKPERIAYIFILPSIIILFMFSIIPLLATIGISFTNMDMYLGKVNFLGLHNFSTAFGDERFWNALKNTFVFALIEVPLQIVLGLLIANALCNTSFFNKMSRTVYFLPVVCSMAAVGIAWNILLDETIGYIPYILEKMGMTNVTFFRNTNTAMPTVIAMTVWKNFGYTMSILVVGIQSISKNYYEASEIDGATKINQFFQITIPSLSASLGFCLITNLIGSLQAFDQMYVTTQGGPQFSTETMVMYIYKSGFSPPYELGYACAMSILVLIINLSLALPLYKKTFMSESQEV